MGSVEMIGDRPGIAFHVVDPEGRDADDDGGAGEQTENMSAGGFHA